MGNICKKLFFKNKPGPKVRTVVPNLTQPENLPYRHKNHPNREYPSNLVNTTKYTILTFLPKNLFEQFHRYANIYFMMVALLNWVPQVSAFGREISMLPLLFVLSVTAIKDAFEDFRRYQSDKRVNTASCRRYSRKASRYVRSSWCELRVGDFVHLSCNEIIPADILLLTSSDSSNLCHIETSNMDGETNLKQRFTVSGIQNTAEGFDPMAFTHSIVCELPNTDIYKFHGKIITKDNHKIPITQNNLLLRGCVIRNTDFVEGLVIYAGPETKAMLNNRGPRYKRSKLERRMNRDLAWCVVLLLFLCFFCAIGAGVWVGRFDDISAIPFIPQQQFDDFSPLFQGFIVFWTYIIIFQAVIPLPLYVSLEVIKLVQVYFIQNDKELYYEPTNKRMECRALNITEDLGQVEYIFSDKTGTLTENQMEFKSCTIGGIDFPHGCETDDSLSEMRRSHHSMSNLSRCSSELWDLKLEPSLQRDVSAMCLRSLENGDFTVTTQTRRVQDFFLLMAICNTVVVSPHAHEDKMDASGLVLPDSDQTLASGKLSYDKLNKADEGLPVGRSKHWGLENGGFTIDDDVSSRTRTPSEGSITDTSTSILSDGTLEGRYDAESPDELALVKAASTYGCRLRKRMVHSVVVELPAEGIVEYDVLHVLPFDSVRKRMSVIVRCPFSKDIILYTKGADSAILSQLNRCYKEKEDDKRLMQLTLDHLDAYAKKGLRTLCMAKRVLDPQDYEMWKPKHLAAEHSMEDRDKKLFESACAIEMDLELLGATGIEDKLQDGVPETIANLRKAGIRMWVLTGDKQETAIQIAYASKLISTGEEVIIINARDKESTLDLLQHHLEQMEKDEEVVSKSKAEKKSSWFASKKKSPIKKKQPARSAALVIDGRTLQYALEEEVDKAFLHLAMKCSSVVCCRSTPMQKAAVVKLVRDELKQMTLAIGDGANDVSMIQTADVGVGISGQEGMQAVMASDFSLPRFRFLERLLLVHGLWCYDRLARFALYMFYKNPLPNFTIFWFQIYSGFSGAITMDQYYLLLLHVLFTAFPPAVNGVFDKNVSAETLLTRLDLYEIGRKGKSYNTFLFWIYILETWLQSIALHFIPHLSSIAVTPSYQEELHVYDSLYQSVLIHVGEYACYSPKAYAGSDVGLWEVGTTMTVSLILTMLLFLGIETWCWTWIHWVVLVGSFLMYWVFAIVLGSVCVTCDHPSNPYWVMQNTVTTPIHWLVVCLTCTVCLLPRFTYRCLQTNLWPDKVLQARLDEKHGLIHKKSSRKKKPKAKKSLDMSASSPTSTKSHQTVNGTRPATSSSVEVQVEAYQNRSMNARATKLKTIESKEL